MESVEQSTEKGESYVDKSSRSHRGPLETMGED